MNYRSLLLFMAVGCGHPGGAVVGPSDDHCGSKVVAVDPAMCAVPSAQTMADLPDFGATLFNAEGDDDDCKYHVKWTSTAIYQNTDVIFTVTVSQKADGSALSAADPYAEIYLDTTHVAPDTKPTATETSPGTYRLGPVRFDRAGRWTIRFHLRSDCDDGESSPHGHAAFFVSVP